MSNPNQIRPHYPNQPSNESFAQVSACPNCWGWQEYAGRSNRKYLLSKWNQTKAFILYFVERFVSGTRKPRF